MGTTPESQIGPLHAEYENLDDKTSGNPIGSSLNVVVTVPDNIEIRMVNASSLSDYEMWVFMASIITNAVVGFLVATIQAYESKATNAMQLLMTTIVFAILFLMTLAKAITKRYSMTRAGKTIRLKATEATDI